MKVTGNTKHLRHADLKALEKLFHRPIDKNELVSFQLAQEIYEIAKRLRRRVGVLISREGKILEVFVGEFQILYLPDLGRFRLDEKRLRRMRLVFSDLSKSAEVAEIPTDIITDLEKLRLDAVISVKEVPGRMIAAYSYLKSNQASPKIQIKNLSTHELDFQEFVQEIEDGLELIQQRKTIIKNQAIVVHVSTKPQQEIDDSILELKELARTAGINIIETIHQKKQPEPKSVLGTGKLEEVVLTALRLGVEIIIFDMELRPGQWRIITNATELKVIDRSMLILDIFAQRAKTSEGALQVELAQLKYNLPKLVEKDAGLSRLSGGIGGRGPGETKLEIGRRRIKEKIAVLEEKIATFKQRREMKRESRSDTDLFLISIIGYTNVGKSTLFNALTKSTVIVENKLFATLDPYQRKLHIEGIDYNKNVLITDTVGFIRDLPKELFAAFRATIEETKSADLIIHLLDGSDININKRCESVESILNDIGANEISRINVINKLDLVPQEEQKGLLKQFDAIGISAEKRSGFDRLVKEIKKRM